MRTVIALSATLALLSGCVHAQGTSPARSVIVLLRVINAADNATRIPGVEIFTVGDGGALRRLGATDVNGEIRLERSALPKSTNAVAIIACHPIFFCGALRADYVAPRDEMTLAIAPFVTD
jgi:hypothetical protein